MENVTRLDPRTGPAPAGPGPQAGRNRRRLQVFVLGFLLVAVLGLAYTFARPAIYESSARLRLEAPPEPTGNTTGEGPSGYLALQREALTSRSVLEAVLARLQGMDQAPHDLNALRPMLAVDTVPAADILLLSARGPARGVLAPLVDVWIEAFRQQHAAETQTDTHQDLGDRNQELAEMERVLAVKREALRKFQDEHHIVSLERGENRVLARQKALSESLAAAEDEVVAARAELAAKRQAAATGQPLAEGAESRSLANLEERANALREEMKDLEQRFTPAYLDLDSHYASLKANLQRVQDDIERRRRAGREAVLAEAEQALASAKAKAASLRQQLGDYRREATEFSARLNEYNTLKDELDELEGLYRQTQQRMVTTLAQSTHPLRLQVLDPPSVPEAPIYPHYARDAAISLAVALLLAWLALLLYDFLSRPPESTAGPQPWPVFYPVPAGLAGSGPEPGRLIEAERQRLGGPAAALPHAGNPSELSTQEIRRLLEAAGDTERVVIGLLLSGLHVKEIAALDWGQVDLDAGRLRLADGRELGLPGTLRDWLAGLPGAGAAAGPCLDLGGGDAPEPELAARLACAAHDAGLNDPESITPARLRHSYLAYLVRQGARLNDLPKVAGAIAPTELLGYRIYSPPGSGRDWAEIEPRHPALAA